MSEMIQFYLEDVMPKAESDGEDIKEHVNSLGEKLKTLRLRLRRCVSSRPAPSFASRRFPKHLLTRLAHTQTHKDGRAGWLSLWAGVGVLSLAHFSLSWGWGWLLGIYM